LLVMATSNSSMDHKAMIIALETASYAAASVAVYGDGIADQITLDHPRDAAARVIPAVHRLCQTHGIDGHCLDAVAVDCGPGSFTGVRIGIATALGLIGGWEIPPVAVSQFDLFTAHVPESESVLVLLDARSRGLLYYAYRVPGDEPLRGVVAPADLPALCATFSAPPKAVVGNVSVDAALLAGHVVNQRTVVDALAVACQAERCRARGIVSLALEPIYLHTSLVKAPRPGA
jgi:tRNA threonylcarbamoyl adenosine modification protein YeaZ